MRGFAFALVAVAVQALDPMELEYTQFLSKFARTIKDTAEFKERLGFFKAVAKFVKEHNAKGSSWKAGINKFADWSPAEFTNMLNAQMMEMEIAPVDPPSRMMNLGSYFNGASKDWRNEGAVAPIKDQGYCGSCWSFSAISAYEGRHAIQTGQLKEFSEQQLVSCDPNNGGCNGGWYTSAWEYLRSHPAATETEWPYLSGQDYNSRTGQCSVAQASGPLVATYSNASPNSVSAMKAAIDKGPTSIAVRAGYNGFSAYAGGVFDGAGCPSGVDHAVTAVGYGTDSATGKDYWLVRNSWGEYWGEGGYIRMEVVDGSGVCQCQSSPSVIESLN